MQGEPRKPLATFEAILTTTNVDSHGERITKQTIEDFFKQFKANAPRWGYLNHDITGPATHVVRDPYLHTREDGEIELRGYIDVYDPEFLKGWESGEYRGLSISYRGRQYRFSSDEDAVDLLFDPLNFDSESVLETVRELNTLGVACNAREWRRKATMSDAILIVTGVLLLKPFIDGFAKRIGERFADKLASLFEKARGPNPTFVLEGFHTVGGRLIKVQIKTSGGDIPKLRSAIRDIPTAIASIRDEDIPANHTRIVLEYDPYASRWSMKTHEN